MKVILGFVLTVASVSALGSGPYLPSDWRPKGPAFYLPSEVERKPAENPPVVLFQGSEASGSDSLREYGPPKLISNEIGQGLPDAVTDQVFQVFEAKESVEKVNSEAKSEEKSIVSQVEAVFATEEAGGEELNSATEVGINEKKTEMVEVKPVVLEEKAVIIVEPIIAEEEVIDATEETVVEKVNSATEPAIIEKKTEEVEVEPVVLEEKEVVPTEKTVVEENVGILVQNQVVAEVKRVVSEPLVIERTKEVGPQSTVIEENKEILSEPIVVEKKYEVTTEPIVIEKEGISEVIVEKTLPIIDLEPVFESQPLESTVQDKVELTTQIYGEEESSQVNLEEITERSVVAVEADAPTAVPTAIAVINIESGVKADAADKEQALQQVVEIQTKKVEEQNRVAEEVRTVEEGVKTVREQVQNIGEALILLENEVKAEQIPSGGNIAQEISGSFEQAPEGFLEYGPPGFKEYGPPQADDLLRADILESLVAEPRNNELRKRRFSPKFKIIRKSH